MLKQDLFKFCLEDALVRCLIKCRLPSSPTWVWWLAVESEVSGKRFCDILESIQSNFKLMTTFLHKIGRKNLYMDDHRDEINGQFWMSMVGEVLRISKFCCGREGLGLTKGELDQIFMCTQPLLEEACVGASAYSKIKIGKFLCHCRSDCC